MSEDEARPEAERLRSVPFFEDLTPEDLERVVRIGERRTFDAGETIIAKDSQGQTLFVILSGRATVEAGGKGRELGPGEFIGEMSLLGRRPRSATVTAIEPTQCLVFEAMYFKPFLIKNPMAVAILEGVVERLREVQDRVG
ncbi:MAG: Crp/Fnr family transcriptional regulator [Actinomycetota bacterium]